MQPMNPPRLLSDRDKIRAQQTMVRARKDLLRIYRMWGFLCLEKLQLTERINQHKRLATNGKVLYYRPDLVLDTSSEELPKYIANGVVQCALGIPWRRRGRS